MCPANGGVERAPEVFEALPRALGALIRPELPTLAEEIVHRIRDTIPEYTHPLDGPFGQTIRLGVEQALFQFADQITDPNAPQDKRAEVYRGIGRLEARQGRSLDALQAAFRVGARLAWRRIAHFGQRSRLPVPTMWLLGDAAQAHIDALAALAVEGYTEVQTHTAGTLARRRSRLLDLLVAESPVPQDQLADLARQTQWPLPRRVAVVALSVTDAAVTPKLSERVLTDLERPDPFLLVPDPECPSWTDGLASKLSGWRAVVGPTVPLAKAGESLRQALDVSALIVDGYVKDGPVVRCADHVSTLWLLRDESLARQLVENRLGPLGALTPKQRMRVRETLLAWLEAHGSATEIAARLDIHPQTVRYRMRQVEKLFGDQLADPHARFEIELALRASELRMRADRS